MSAEINRRSWKRPLKPRGTWKRLPPLRIWAVCAGFFSLPVSAEWTRSNNVLRPRFPLTCDFFFVGGQNNISELAAHCAEGDLS